MLQFEKDPAASLDYGLDLNGLKHGLPGAKSNWLAEGETVTAYTVTGAEGLSVANVAHADGAITFWASNGSAGVGYAVTVSWTTSAGRIDRRTILINVVER